MDAIGLLIFIIVAGVILWAVNTYIPMQPSIKKILNIVAVIIIILVVLSAFGVFDYLGGFRVPRLHR